jgi:1,4-dihydroxy-2-naphthoate octaprenyltransferase
VGTEQSTVKAWIEAFRLRTLPLALSCIGMGSFLAAYYQDFQWEVCVLSIATTLFLQILSNLANDYGDSIHGADGKDREGPSRAVQAGHISAVAMKRSMIIFGILSFASGMALLYFSTGFSSEIFYVFLALGIASILAAVAYTNGKRPYGYMGLGDIFVFMFFGLVGVVGTFYLHTNWLNWEVFLPAAACGFLATGVLNVNNIRDIQSDKVAGKRSIPVRIGRKKAELYHQLLISGAIICASVFVFVTFNSIWNILFVAAVPLLTVHLIRLNKGKTAADIDPLLKQLAITTLLFVLTFGIGLLV